MQRPRDVGRIFIQLSVCALLVGCGDRRHQPRSADPTELVLFCGAGIRPAAEALIDDFHKKNPAITIVTNYGGSGRLLGQIATMKKKGDLFMPGAEWYVDKALTKKLAVAGTKRIVAYFVPVLFVAKGNPKQITGVEDLGRTGLKIGFGDERSCAVGKKTLTILSNYGIDASHLAENLVYKSGTVNELAAAVQLNNVDAVIVWDANARHFYDYGDIIDIPPEKNDVSTIPVVRLSASNHPEEADRFISYISSERGKILLTEKGYTVNLQQQSFVHHQEASNP